MVAVLVSIPIVTGCVGWLIGWLVTKLIFYPRNKVKAGSLEIQGVLYQKETALKNELVGLIKAELVATSSAGSIVGSKNIIEKLKPALNHHIDQFLKEKLKEKMPVIGMLLGERTIKQLKEVFMEELELLFPTILASYMKEMSNDQATDKLIRERVNAFPVKQLEIIAMKQLAPELRKLRWLAAVFGLLTGCVHVLIIKLLVA